MLQTMTKQGYSPAVVSKSLGQFGENYLWPTMPASAQAQATRNLGQSRQMPG